MKFFNKIKEKNIIKYDIPFLLIFIICLITILINKDKFQFNWSRNVNIENVWITTCDNNGNTYVVDNNRSRILRINSKGEVDREINKFTYIDDMEIDEAGNIYVINTEWDSSGFTVASDTIYCYNPNKNSVTKIYQKEYSEATKHQLFGLTVFDDQIVVLGADDNYVSKYVISLETRIAAIEENYSYEDAITMLQDIKMDKKDGSIYAIDKRGSIIKFNEADNSYTSVFNWGVLNEKTLTEPYRMDVVEGIIFFTDIASNNVYMVHGEEYTVVYDGEFSALNVTASEFGDDVKIGLAVDDIFTVLDKEGTQVEGLSSCPYIIKLYIPKLLLNIAFILLIIAAVYLLPRIVVNIISKIKTTIDKVRIVVIIAILLVAGVLMFQSINSFKTMLFREKGKSLEYVAYNIANGIDKTDLDDIVDTTSFMNEGFKNIYNVMGKFLDYSYDSSMYCNVVRYDKQTEKVYDIVFFDNSIGAYYPLTGNEADEVIKIYNDKQILQSNAQTANGGFIYVKVPVIDNNEVVAVVEVGTWGYTITDQVSQMSKDIIFQLILWLVLIIFVFTEFFEIISLRAKYKKSTDENKFPLHVNRGLVFMVFVAYNLPTAFLPVYVAKMYKGGWNFVSDSIAKSLPISINMALIGVAALLGYRILKKMSFKKAMFVAAFVTMVGDLLLALAGNFEMILIGLILNGIGVGFQMNLLHTITTYAAEKSQDSTIYTVYQSGSLSGIMVGMAFGAVLADYIGYKKVFLATVVIWAIVAIVTIFVGKSLKLDGISDKNKVEKKENIFKFVFNPRIFLFLILMLFMYVMTSSFIYYFVPIYCDNMNFNSSVSCLLILVSSICGIYLSSSATRFFETHFGKYSIYFSSIIALISLLLFAYIPTTNILIVTLLLMGFGTSFGTATRLTVYSEFSATKKFGVERATGVYDLIERVGEAVGPMLFATLLAGSFEDGVKIFVAISFVACLIYYISEKIGKKKKE